MIAFLGLGTLQTHSKRICARAGTWRNVQLVLFCDSSHGFKSHASVFCFCPRLLFAPVLPRGTRTSRGRNATRWRSDRNIEERRRLKGREINSERIQRNKSDARCIDSAKLSFHFEDLDLGVFFFSAVASPTNCNRLADFWRKSTRRRNVVLPCRGPFGKISQTLHMHFRVVFGRVSKRLLLSAETIPDFRPVGWNGVYYLQWILRGNQLLAWPELVAPSTGTASRGHVSCVKHGRSSTLLSRWTISQWLPAVHHGSSACSDQAQASSVCLPALEGARAPLSAQRGVLLVAEPSAFHPSEHQTE